MTRTSVERAVRLLCALALALAALTRDGTARAAIMHHHDLTSLALEADAIVRARQIAEKKVDPYTTERTMKVTRSYKGELSAGASFVVAYDLYTTEPFDGIPRDGGAPKLGEELVFFLRRAPSDGGAPGFRLVSSGLRIFLDGKAHRFEQWNNPGGFVPVPQGRDPYDLFGDTRGGEPLDAAGLDAAILEAVARAVAIETALAAPDRPATRRRLVSLAGFEPEAAPVGASLAGFYADAAGKRIVEALAKRGDLHATLEALSRTPGVGTFQLRTGLDAEQVLRAAENPRLREPSRVAALRLAEGMWPALREMPSADARLAALLSDPSPEVRLAALAVRPRETPTERMKEAVLARWKAEKEDRVRIALVGAAAGLGIRGSLTRGPPTVFADLRRDVVRVAWAAVDERVNLVVRRAEVVAKRDGEPDRTFDLMKGPASYSNGSTGSCVSRIVDPSLRPGDYAITLDVVVADLAKREPDVTRRFVLGTMRVDAADRAPAASTPSAAAPAASASDLGDAGPPPVSPARRSACGCESVGGGASRAAAPWGALFAWIVAGARRRARTAKSRGRRADADRAAHS